jgi:uncharacterized membrane protein
MRVRADRLVGAHRRMARRAAPPAARQGCSSLPEKSRMTIMDEGAQAPDADAPGAEAPITAKKPAKLMCAISGKERPRREIVSLDAVRPSLAERIRRDRPDLAADAFISLAELAKFRTLYVEELLLAENGELTELDRQVAESIATHETLAENTDEEFEEQWTLAERLSDHLASFGGSWTFITLFGAVLVVWMGFNIVAMDAVRFDPYPYILLNLVLSTLAAIQAPIIMMSQKRTEAKDRLRSQNDYQVNLKAELEIRHLHEKLDHLLSRQWQRLAEIQQMQLELMHDLSRGGRRK